MVKAGDTLTFRMELITIGGQILFKKGQKVIVRDVEIKKGHWAWGFSGIWYPDKLLWIKLEDHYGLYQPDCFEELCEKNVINKI